METDKRVGLYKKTDRTMKWCKETDGIMKHVRRLMMCEMTDRMMEYVKRLKE